jgi:predicted GIY-YIG superfamily endonuclease
VTKVTAIAEAIVEAPRRPGVYFFFGPQRGLVYVGKASNLRRRLAQHARPGVGRLSAIYPFVREVRWEVLPDDDAAAAREAELILALRPAFNASLADDGRWTYLIVAASDDTMRFTLSQDARADSGRIYGCFPYLGTGVHSRPAIACSDGYTAFLRLLWASGSAPLGSQFPPAVQGASPPAAFDVAAAPSLRGQLHAFLAGTSDRLLGALDALVVSRDAYMQPGLRRDRNAAAEFFRYGPRAIRALRLRHGIRSRPLSRALFERLLRAEVEDALGSFSVADADLAEPWLGRRDARRRTLGDALRRLEESAAESVWT